MFRTRTSIFASLVIGLLVLLPNTTHGVYGHWEIEQFESIIEVRADGTMLVTESIYTEFDDDAYKHGIYREIPYVYRTELGSRVKIDLDVYSVLMDGAPVEYKVENATGEVRVRIGDPDAYVTGSHEYEITYEVDRAILFSENVDEVYWNVTGNAWEVPITDARAFVRLPGEPKSVSCYSGPAGSVQQNCGIAEEGNGVAFVAGDYMTVAIGLPKGVIEEPTGFERAKYFIADNWSMVLPLPLLFLLFGLWWRLGRDPKVGTVIPEYAPPDGISPAYAGYFVKHRLTSQLITSMIIWLATKGVIEMHVEQEEKRGKMVVKSLRLVKTGKDVVLDKAHRELLDVLFKKRTETTLSDLKKINAKKFLQLKRSIADHMHEAGWYTKSSLKWRIALLTIAGILFYVMLFFGMLFGVATVVSMAIVIVAMVGFAIIMPKRTLAGAEMARRVLGFKDFMHTAERYRSEWQEKEGIFAEYLPYAIAFNDVKHWAKVFKDVGGEQPDWYHSNIGPFNAMLFTDSLTTATTAMSTAMAPKSSGGASVGGGSSGGGFGGGGGGSW